MRSPLAWLPAAIAVAIGTATASDGVAAVTAIVVVGAIGGVAWLGATVGARPRPAPAAANDNTPHPGHDVGWRAIDDATATRL